MSRHSIFHSNVNMGHFLLSQSRKTDNNNKTISNSDWSVAIDGRGQYINFTSSFDAAGQVLKH